MSMEEMRQWLLDQSFYIFGDNGYYDNALIVGIARNKGYTYNALTDSFTKI